VGSSIIWCAALGWIIMLLDYFSYASNKNSYGDRVYINAAKVAIGADILAIFYYAMANEAITTIAHICAIFLGICLWIVMKLLC
jgi:hypothetical protein